MENSSSFAGHYPNVRARLRRIRTIPGVPDTTTIMVIWLDGARFRVRDESGRPAAEIIGDVTEPRGFGVLPHTIEDFMDAGDRARADAGPVPRRPTDLYGDRASGEGVVQEPHGSRWTIAAAALAPVAEQLLAAVSEQDTAVAVGPVRLGRSSQEYRTALVGTEDGREYRSEVRRLSAVPYVLLREVRQGDLFVEVETLELAENVVTDADLRPPVA
jgi:hypothetical protein